MSIFLFFRILYLTNFSESKFWSKSFNAYQWRNKDTFYAILQILSFVLLFLPVQEN